MDDLGGKPPIVGNTHMFFVQNQVTDPPSRHPPAAAIALLWCPGSKGTEQTWATQVIHEKGNSFWTYPKSELIFWPGSTISTPPETNVTGLKIPAIPKGNGRVSIRKHPWLQVQQIPTDLPAPSSMVWGRGGWSHLGNLSNGPLSVSC